MQEGFQTNQYESSRETKTNKTPNELNYDQPPKIKIQKKQLNARPADL